MVESYAKQEHCPDKRPVSFWRVAVVRRPSCGHPESAVVRVAHASAPLRSLSLGRRRSTQACCARAPCRAGCGRSAHYVRGLHRQETSLLRCVAVVRRTSCGLPEPAGFCVARASAALRMLSLETRRSTRACCARAVPRWLWSAYALGKGVAPLRGLSLSARVHGATYQLRSLRISRLLRGTRERGTALAVSREEAQHASLLRARRASLIVVGPCTRQGHCRVKRSLSFGAPPWCHVPAAASQNQPAFAWHARARYCACCFSGGDAAHELLARAPYCAGCGRPMH